MQGSEIEHASPQRIGTNLHRKMGNICMLLDYIINCSHEQLIFKKEKGGEKKKGEKEKGGKGKEFMIYIN